MTHVLVIPSWYPSADSPVSGIFFRDQALALKEIGFRVGVAAPIPQSIRRLVAGRRSHIPEVSIEHDNGIPTYRSHFKYLAPGMSSLNTRAWLTAGERLCRRYIAEFGRPDVMHAQSAILGGVLAQKLGTEMDIPYVVTEHSSAFALDKISAHHIGMARHVYANAAARVVVSPELGKTLERVVGPEVKPWTWIPNMVDTFFLEKPEASVGKTKAAAPFVFLNVGLLKPTKGQALLLEAFSSKFAGCYDTELRIVGSGRLRHKLIRRTKDLGITEQVRFLGLLDRAAVRDEMRAADVFVLSSLYETFGVVLLEALACGTPVIATRCGGPQAFLTESDGLLVDVGDIDSLSQAMGTMRKTAVDYDHDALSSRCSERFGSEALASKLGNVLNKAIHQ